MPRILALCGGVGGAKLADGLQQVLSPDELTIIVNTGDDFVHRGLPVWPDIDTVLYTLGGIANPEQGWGRADESWQVQREWQRLGEDTWFQLGDRDIALHLLRREWLDAGMAPTQVCAALAQRFGIPARVLPMAEVPAPTTVISEEGPLPFQEYFVRRRCQPVLRGLSLGAAAHAAMSAPVREALEDPRLEGIILCPSNPYLSVAPILAVPGLRQHLAATAVPVIAVSPIIGGEALKGPAAKIMRELGVTPSPRSVAQEYRDFLDLLLVDPPDLPPADPDSVAFEAAPIVMRSREDRQRLASHCLASLARLAAHGSRRPRG